jgi:hypothetical protein
MAAGAAAQEKVGSVASLQGTAEVLRGGGRSDLTLGAAVFRDDEILTGRPGRLRVVFRDDSVLVLADDSHVRVSEQLFGPEAGVFESAFELLQGKVRALVGDYYEDPRASFELRTKTAISGVRGTEFIVVYDPVGEITEVIGISGEVAVWSPIDPKGTLVIVTEREITRVAAGESPSPPAVLGQPAFDGYREGTGPPGEGLPEGLTERNPLLRGAHVPPSDRAEPVTALVPATGGDGAPPVDGFPEISAPSLGDTLQQPVNEIDSPGELRVEF